MEYRYRTIQHTPMVPVYVDAYKDTANYTPKKVKSIWEWFEKDWDEWLDIITCWWVDRRKIVVAGKSLYARNVEYKTYTIDLEKIVKAILDYNHEYQCITGRPIKYILVGHNEYYKLHYDINVYSFMFPTQLINKGHQFLFAGCQIILVPNMEGMIFLPEMPAPFNTQLWDG